MSSDDSGMPAPPASFEFLVASLQTQAQIQLGVLHFGPEQERPEPNLPLARHAIDLIAMLVDKTKGNLSWDEQRLAENALTELRFQFVQAASRQRPAAPAAAPDSGASPAGGSAEPA